MDLTVTTEKNPQIKRCKSPRPSSTKRFSKTCEDEVAKPKQTPSPRSISWESWGQDYDWPREQLIGKGRCTNCHEVVKVPRKKDGKVVAVRLIGSPICRADDVTDAYAEVEKLAALPDHENLVKFTICSEQGFSFGNRMKPFLEMEYYPQCSLNAKIQKKFELRGAFTARSILWYMHQLTQAVAFLHAHGILHRDVRPKNMLIIGPNDTLKLGDVGGPKIFQNRLHASRYPGAFWPAVNRLNAGPNHCCLMSPNGSWAYMPPEIMCEFRIPATKDIHVVSRDHYVAASDIWSMGIVLYELLCLKVPFTGRTPKQIQKSIASEMPLAQLSVPAVRDYPPRLRLLVRSLLCLDPEQRIKETELEKIVRQELQKLDMFKAVKDGDEETVQTLLEEEKVNVNMTDTGGYTPLMWAAEYGYRDIVEVLLKHGANITAKNRYGWTALDWAGSKEVVESINRGTV